MDRQATLRSGMALIGMAAISAMTAMMAAPAPAQAQEGNAYTLETMQQFNEDLKALWMDIQIEQVEVLTLGEGRSSSRLHRQPFRWVANDARRAADGANLTYLVDQAGLAGSALDPQEAEAAIDRAMATWAAEPCVRQKLNVVKRPDRQTDPDIFDALLGYGDFGNYTVADIVHAGWMPPSFFDAVAGPGSGETVLAFSVTFVYVDADGRPSDVNGDKYLDTAANEVYYNEAFSWLLGGGHGIDLESVALHELGHAMGIGHVGPPIEAIMNPVYAGVHRSLRPLDVAALCSVWSRWPN